METTISRIHQARGQNDHVTSLWHKELWRHSYILWKVVYRNTCYVFIILVANIIWLSDHVIRSSYLLDVSFLHVSPRFFMSQRCDMIVLAARLMGTLFWPPNRTFNAKKKNGQGELARRLDRLFLILNTAINQKIQKKFRVISTLNRLCRSLGL